MAVYCIETYHRITWCGIEMIIVDNISKSYGNQELFKKTGFKLNSRERLGLVGRSMVEKS